MSRRKKPNNPPRVVLQGGSQLMLLDGVEPDPAEFAQWQSDVMRTGVDLVRAYLACDPARQASLTLRLDLGETRNALLFLVRVAGEFARTLGEWDEDKIEGILSTISGVALEGEGLR